MSRNYKIPTIKELFEAGVHFGHHTRRWHPAMESYIFTVKNDIHIIDLEQSLEKLEKACEFLYETAKKGGDIIFVGTKRQCREIVELGAKRCGAKFVTERWLGGTITNFHIIKKNVDKLIDKKKGREEGAFDKYTKKERLLIDREIEKLNKNVGGLLGLKGVPAAIFVVDPKREKTAVSEAIKAGLPLVALIDTNSDPRSITYPIPGNDDAIKSTAIIVKAIADAVENGYKDVNEESKEDVKLKEEVKKPKEAKKGKPAKKVAKKTTKK
jgi:small subunit ribosomal protein S2